MTKSKIFLYFCLSFIGGIFLDSIVYVPQLLMLGFLILGILLISVFWKYKKIVIIGFCLLFLVTGVWRHQQAELKIIHPLVQRISFVGIVVSEPDIRENKIKLIIEVDETSSHLHAARASRARVTEKISGKILVTTKRYPEYQYGDKLKITGKIQVPPVFEDFNYRSFLAKNGIYSVMHRPQIELLERENYIGATYVIYAKILSFKDKLRESIYQNLSPPQSSVLGAMILGDKRRMSDGLKEKLNITGVRHITAISGMHITILSIILMQILIGLGFWRKQAFYLTLTFLILFIVMVGLPPSAIRAGIMGGLFLLAQYLGRQNFSIRAVVFAAAAMLIENPLLLRLDVGFQLSFLALMGIIYLGPIFENWLKRVPDNLLGFIKLRSIMILTFSAQLFTLPILIYNFGRISLIAPLTNVLILPLLPFILGAGFLFSVMGIIWQTLGWVFSWPAWLLLTYLTTIVDWLSQIPLAALTLQNIHWVWLVVAYLVLGIIIWRLQKSQKLKFLKY